MVAEQAKAALEEGVEAEAGLDRARRRFRRQAAHFGDARLTGLRSAAGRLAEDPPRRLVPGAGASTAGSCRCASSARRHYLVLTGGAPDACPVTGADFRAALEEHRDWLRTFVTESSGCRRTRRSGAGAPARVADASRSWAGPLDLVELGPSAGLNLLCDRYRYHYPRL